MLEDSSDLFVVAVSAVIFKENKILMMKRSLNKKAGPGIWEMLSGRVQHGEELLEALHREIEEESNLIVEIEKRPIDLYTTTRLGKPMLLVVYIAKYISGEVQLSQEHCDYHFGSLDEFKERCTLKRLIQSVEKAFKQKDFFL